MSTGSSTVRNERLRLSRAPAAELAAAALEAREASGVNQPDYIVIAVDPDELERLEPVIKAAAAS